MYDIHGNGTAWALSALDFDGTNDNRLAVWQFRNTKSISGLPNIIPSGYLGTGVPAYGQPPPGVQRDETTRSASSSASPSARSRRTTTA